MPFNKINKAGGKAGAVIGQGSTIGQQILPELFPGGSGLDRINFGDVNQQFLQPGVTAAQGFLDDTGARFGEIMDMRRARLGGLNTAESQALKENLFRNIDRQKAAATRDVARTRGLGSGASFAQKRALARDFGNQSTQANRQLLLDDYGIRQQALADFEASNAAMQAAQGGALDRLSGLRQLQATTRLGADQFNAGQQGAELAGRIGAISTGAGLVQDERDRLAAKQQQNQLLNFLADRDAANFAQLQGLF